MSTLDLLNEMMVSIDADMREQRRNARYDFPLKKGWAKGLARCPDWPEARLDALMSYHTQWYAADVVELGLRADGTLSAGDAIWLLTHPGALPRKVLLLIAESCTRWCGIYAMDAYRLLPITALQEPIPPEGTAVDWRKIEFAYRITARMLDAVKQVTRGAEAVAWHFMRTSRAAGMLHALQLCEGEDHPQLACVQRITQLAMLCAPVVAAEQQRQLRHIHALVT